jgi:hypothetical protein
MLRLEYNHFKDGSMINQQKKDLIPKKIKEFKKFHVEQEFYYFNALKQGLIFNKFKLGD